jgi:hypothetical protein
VGKRTKWELHKRELSKGSSSILNSVLRLTELHYFYMDSEVSKAKGLSDTRFGSITFLFRLAGIPFKMKKIPTIYTVYMTIAIICTCTTYVGMFADVYVHRDDLGHAMTTLRVLIPFTNSMWIFLYCR